jgi:hypothetical protein
MDKFTRYNPSQWGYQSQRDRPSRKDDFVPGHRSKRRLSLQQRSLKSRRIDRSVAVATIEALIAIINVIEKE